MAAVSGASLLESMLSGKGVIRGGDRVIEESEGAIATIRERGTIRPGQNF